MTLRDADDDQPLQAIRRKLNPVPWPRHANWFVLLFVGLLALNLLVLLAVVAH